jgi:hypothetical protein
VAAIDIVVLFPKAATHLQPDLDLAGIGHGLDGGHHLVGDLGVDLAQDTQRDGADAPVGLGRRRLAGGGVLPGDGDALVVLGDLADLGVVGDQALDLLGEGLADHVHAAHRLEHGGLHLVAHEEGHRGPDLGIQHVVQACRALEGSARR